MGTITIKVPQKIHIEYRVSNMELTESIIEKLKNMRLTPSEKKANSILGLFANDAELVDRATELAMQSRENNPLRAL